MMPDRVTKERIMTHVRLRQRATRKNKMGFKLDSVIISVGFRKVIVTLECRNN